MQGQQPWWDREGNLHVPVNAIAEPGAPQRQESRPGYGYYSYSAPPRIREDGLQLVPITALAETPRLNVDGQRRCAFGSNRNGGEGMHWVVQALLIAGLVILILVAANKCSGPGSIDWENWSWSGRDSKGCTYDSQFVGTHNGVDVYNTIPTGC